MRPSQIKESLLAALIMAGTNLWGLAWAADAPPAGQTAPGHMTDIHDIKPALPMGADLGWLIWLAGAVVAAGALAFLAWWLWRRRRRPADAPAVPLPSPEEEAYSLLDDLAAGDNGDLKRFYFRLSAILRRYTERRYGFPAAEMTTEELLPAMDRLGLSADVMHQIQDFCRRCDPIKFAGAPGETGRLAHELALVRDFVRLTTPSMDGQGEPAEVIAEETPPLLPGS